MQQVTRAYDTSRLQNDTRTVDDLLADDAAAEVMAKASIGRAAIECCLVRADIFWIASNVLGLRGRQLSTDGEIRSLADFARARQTTYNTATSLQKLAPVKGWIRAEISRGMVEADGAGIAYVAPHWKEFVAMLMGKEPTQRRTPTDKPKPAQRLRAANEKIVELERQLAERPPQVPDASTIRYKVPEPDEPAPQQPAPAIRYKVPESQSTDDEPDPDEFDEPTAYYDWEELFHRFDLAGLVLAKWIKRQLAAGRFDLADLCERCQDFWTVLVPDDITELPESVCSRLSESLSNAAANTHDIEHGFLIFRFGDQQLLFDHGRFVIEPKPVPPTPDPPPSSPEPFPVPTDPFRWVTLEYEYDHAPRALIVNPRDLLRRDIIAAERERLRTMDELGRKIEDIQKGMDEMDEKRRRREKESADWNERYRLLTERLKVLQAAVEAAPKQAKAEARKVLRAFEKSVKAEQDAHYEHAMAGFAREAARRLLGFRKTPSAAEITHRYREKVKQLIEKFGCDTATGYREELQPLTDAVKLLRKQYE